MNERVDNRKRRATKSCCVELRHDTVVCHHLALHLKIRTWANTGLLDGMVVSMRYVSHHPEWIEHTHRQQVLPMCALLELRYRPILPTYTCAQLLKHPLLSCFPISPATVFKHAIELLLRLSSTFLDGGDEILFMSMTEIASNVSILKRLQWRESGLRIEMCDRACKSRCINMCLGK